MSIRTIQAAETHGPSTEFDKGDVIPMVHEYEVNGILVKTGDIICTADGGPLHP